MAGAGKVLSEGGLPPDCDELLCRCVRFPTAKFLGTGILHVEEDRM
jgi:hypothetical protein